MKKRCDKRCVVKDPAKVRLNVQRRSRRRRRKVGEIGGTTWRLDSSRRARNLPGISFDPYPIVIIPAISLTVEHVSLPVALLVRIILSKGSKILDKFDTFVSFSRNISYHREQFEKRKGNRSKRSTNSSYPTFFLFIPLIVYDSRESALEEN